MNDVQQKYIITAGTNFHRFAKMRAMQKFRMQQEFDELVLQQFKDDVEDDTFGILVGGAPDDVVAGIKDGVLILTRADIKSIFAPTITEIISLIREEIKTVEKEELPISVWFTPCGGSLISAF